MKISHKSPKKDLITAEIADANLEITYLKQIYTKLAGANPSLDVSINLTKEQLLTAITELTKPSPDPLGINNIQTGAYSAPIGEGCETVGRASLAYGYKAKARNAYQVAHGKAFLVPGDGQYTHQVLTAITTSDAPVKIGEISIPMTVGGMYSITMEIFGVSDNASAYGVYTFRALIKSDPVGVSTIVPTQFLNTNLLSTPGPGGVNLLPVSGGLNLMCGGVSNVTMRWIIVAKTLEIVF